jgi:SAM-dependent methyltransferase
MDHSDHLKLLTKGIPKPGGVWGEFGSGRGAFTLALAELIGPTGTIHSVDKNGGVLNEQAHAVQRRFANQAPRMHYLTADYTQRLDLPALDGVLMANALHFQRKKGAVLRLILNYLRPGGSFILVEYNIDRGNPWVPHPISLKSWEVLAKECGYENTRILAGRPSRFLGEIYSAISYKHGNDD